jgi:hypothetical protein
MGISKPTAYEYVKTAKKKLCIKNPNDFKGSNPNGSNVKTLTKNPYGKKYAISLHNDSIKIKGNFDYNVIKGVVKQLKNITYKQITAKDAYINAFPNKTLVITFKQEITAKTLKLAYNKATKRIINFINNLNIKNLTINDKFEQVSRHYAILDTELAKKVYDEGKRLFLYDINTKKLRGFVDFSDKKKGGMPHLEFVNNDYSYTDTEKMTNYLESIINKPHYTPDQTRGMIETILKIQLRHAENIEKHLEVLNKIEKAIDRLGK